MTSTQQRPTAVDTTSLAARLGQAAMAIVLAIVSVLLLVTTHRFELTVLGVDLPAGLLLGAVFQAVVCLFLWSATGTRFPLLVLGEGAGGGVLLPAVIADQAQYSGWIVQGIGILIPFALALVITVAGRGRSRAR